MNNAESPAILQGRMTAVDALRGFDMFWIVGGGELVRCLIRVFVNPIPGPLAFQFGHVEWEGFAAWDLIMPLFLFIVGVSLPLSFAQRLERGDSRRSIGLHAVKRVVILWILGMIAQGNLLNLAPAEGHLYSDTLQAIALLLFVVVVSRPLSSGESFGQVDSDKNMWPNAVKRIGLLWLLGMIALGHFLPPDSSELHLYSNTLQSIASGYLVATLLMLTVGVYGQAIAAALLLIGFWLLMTFVPVPGHGAGVLTPEGNLAMYVDEVILGRFRDGTHYTWILSSMTFSATVLLGVLSGHLLRSNRAPKTKAFYLLCAGIGGLVLGKLTGIGFPIVKHIWTSSMVLYAAGWSWLLLAAFYWIIDVLEFRKWAFPFTVIGMNAIFAYMAGEVFNPGNLDSLVLGTDLRDVPPAAAFSFAVVVFGIFWLLLYGMYRKRIFIKI